MNMESAMAWGLLSYLTKHLPLRLQLDHLRAKYTVNMIRAMIKWFPHSANFSIMEAFKLKKKQLTEIDHWPFNFYNVKIN